MQVTKRIGIDNLGIVAAGVAFYSFLAIFPAISALVSVYGLVVEPQAIAAQVGRLSGVLPEPAQELIGRQLQQIAGGSQGALGWGVALSILLALWSANNGTKALFKGINIAFHSEGSRGYLRENALTLLFTLGGVILVVLAMGVIVVVPALIAALGLSGPLLSVAGLLRWPLLGGVVIIGLIALYRYAPAGSRSSSGRSAWGALAATVLWLAASWLFSLYVANFGSYNSTYGSLAAVVVLLLWFLLTSFIVLIGAEINAYLES